MAVSSINAISIIGLTSSMDDVMTLCGMSQAFHPDEVSTFYSDTRNFVPVADYNPYSEIHDKFAEILKAAKIEPEVVEIKSFNKTEKQIQNYTNKIIDELGLLLSKSSKKESEIEQCKRSIEETGHFIGYDLDMKKILSCEYVKANFGRLPKESFDKLSNYDDNPYVMFLPCVSDESHYWGVYICPINEAEEIDRIFSGLYFEHYQITGMDGTPEEFYKKQNEKLVYFNKELKAIQSEIESYVSSIKSECLKYYTKLLELNIFYNIRTHALRYNKSFIITGWIPKNKTDEFVKKLNSIESIECTVSDGKAEIQHSPPVKLKNKKFVKPFEFFIDMYGTPLYNEIDPSPLVAITYTILFGIMFADVGQGIVVSIIGYLMWKYKKMGIGKILVPCGISSSLFGLVFGSLFGLEHALDPIYHAIGFANKPVDIISSATVLLVTAISIGVCLIPFTMILNIFSSFKRRDFENAIFGPNGFAGLVFYVSLLFGLIATLAFNIHVMNLAYILCLIILPIILIFLREPLGKFVEGEKGWKPEKMGEYIVQNLFELFEMMLSYMSNTISFVRIGAFVLVHAGMMIVVFT
ncbi:MAG: V-type ATPase 116kDa subunit family protein, partial [Bacillota bacterium]|nr:V-type ATPase 116kDa subunit family protein [Bacillota bacterium]